MLVGHSLFPDETDFRVLMALPVPHHLVFGAKLLALGLFVGLFVTAAHAALLPLSILISLACRRGRAMADSVWCLHGIERNRIRIRVYGGHGRTRTIDSLGATRSVAHGVGSAQKRECSACS